MENREAYRVDRRIQNGYALGRRTAVEATILNRHVSEVSAGEPSLETNLRAVEDTLAIGTQGLIYHYMTRP
ncbi:hypothetical protein EV643_1352 [Kribbella sp. VKM Ac-2527]|uniref:Uncharacterized protein n=1 Tax=Kribbella caucasensis TaxID=2512215 RepID=A0A4R6J5I7_9ACTN|nr:hypothetical protein EV643_1352 [Kribbella sp. VKM Ac-2527]